MTLRIVVAGMVGALIAAAVPPAGAAERIRNYPGALCVPVGSGALIKTANGTAENRSAGSVEVICAAERPIGQGGAALRLAGKVFVIDDDPSAAVCCQVASRNPAGAEKYGNSACSTGAKGTYQTLNLPEIVDTKTWSHFMIKCSLPARVGSRVPSSVLVYRTIQN